MKKFILILLSLFIFNGCSTESVSDEPSVIVEEEEPVDPQIAIDAANRFFDNEIGGLPLFTNDPVINPPVVQSTDPSVEDGNFLCTTTNYKAAPGYNEMILLDPSSDVIFPGALIKGGSIATGEYSPIITSRKPMTMSISLENISGDASRTFNPVLNDFRNARNDILNSVVPAATPARISFEIKSVYSRQQLNASIAANYSGATVDVGGSFDFSSDKRENSIVVKYVQAYYTIDINPFENPSDLFETLPDVNSFGANRPVYVSTVTYGRMILFTATSSYSNTEMEAAFNAAFDSGVTSGDVQVSAGNQKIIENSSIKAFVLGGSGSSGAQVVTGIEGVKSYILGGGNYSKESPGAPLSYKLREIKNKNVTDIVLTTEYKVRKCDKLRSSFKITMVNIDCSGGVNDEGDQQMYGSIGVRKWEANKNPQDNFEGWIWGPFNDDTYKTASGNIVAVDQSMTVELETGEQNYIELFGALAEYDTSIFDGDEFLGSASRKLFLTDLLDVSTTQLNFSGDGDIAKVNFVIEPLD